MLVAMNTKPLRRNHQQAPEKIRIFIAIDLPEFMRTAIRTIQTDIRSSGFKARLTRPENVHLTLKFLGDVDTHRIEKINAAIKIAVKEIAPINLGGRSLGVFPNSRRPRVLWMGLFGQIGALLRLQKKIDAQLALLGFAKEKRTFTGHLTIGRIKGKAPLRQVNRILTQYETFATEPFAVKEVILFKSQLTPDGSIYTRLGSGYLKPLRNVSTAESPC